MNTGSRWTTIESDPGVFTALVREMGCKGVELTEFVSLEEEDFVAMHPAFGLVFLFKWVQEQDDRQTLSREETDPDLFFARQIVHNACATQALLSLLLNQATLDVGQGLRDFKEFTKEFDPKLKGESIGDNETIRSVHNSFARPEPFVVDSDSPSASSSEDKEDVFHFIAYIPFKGYVYELDGLKAGPIRLAKIPDDAQEGDWLRVVCPHVRARVNRYANSEVYFNLMAMVPDRRDTFGAAVQKLEGEVADLQARGADASAALTHLAQAREQLADAQAVHLGWEEENARRKHNYIPFIVATLKLLAKKKRLRPLVRAAQEKELARASKQQQASSS